MSCIKVLSLSGSAYEIGKQHGKWAKEEVAYSLDSYEKLFWYERNLSWEQAVELAKQHINTIEEVNSELLEEMEGVADGASVRFEDILTLNARSEIALTGNKFDGCTSVSVMPPLSDKAYLAQTWDWRPSQTRSLIALKINHKDTKINMITEGGIIGKIGCNHHGLGVCLNALRTDIKSHTLPVHLGLREVLNSTDIEEAKHKVKDGKIASSVNMLMAQHQFNAPQALNIELSPIHSDERETKSNYLYHTNHFCSHIMRQKIKENNVRVANNSVIRKKRMKELIMTSIQSKKTIDKHVIRQWLSDHDNEPFSICRHKDHHTSEYVDTITAFAVIMNLTDKTMKLLEGQPCNPIKEYHFTFEREEK